MEVYVRNSLVLAIVCYGLYLFFTKKDFNLISFFAFLLPIKAFLFDIGLQIYGYYIPLFISLIIHLVTNNFSGLRFNKKYLFFIFYTLIGTIYISNFVIVDWAENIHNTFFREEGRYISSILKFLVFQTGIFFIINSQIKNKAQCFHLIRVYLLSIQILILVAIAQLIIYIMFGFDISPYTSDSNGNGITAITNVIFNNLPFPRLTSLGGEPKGFAANLVVAYVVLDSFSRKGIYLIKNLQFWKWIIIFCILLTLSSGGILLIFIYFVFVSLNSFSVSKFLLRWNLKKSIFFIVLILILVSTWDILNRVIEARILDRADRLTSEDVDKAIQAFLVDNPKWSVFGSGLGNIHNLAYQYIDDNYLKLLMKGQIFVSRYGVVKLISETGFIGFVLFLWMYLSLIFKSLKINDNTIIAFRVIVFMMLVFYMARSGYIEPQMFFLLGIFSSLVYFHNNEKKSKKI